MLMFSDHIVLVLGDFRMLRTPATTICDNLPPTIPFLMLSTFSEYFPQNVQTTPDPPSPIGCTRTGWKM